MTTDLSNTLVCSFYTADAYYRGHAATLRAGLDRLGVAHEMLEIEKAPGEEWPDICRKKIPFLAGVCDRNPEKKVYWIDVDCDLLDLPDFVNDFSADLIGFQRGFGSPLTIGYRNRTRFWEPCFFGINATVGGRKFIADAKDFEAESDVRATDDYFFEESWRANAQTLSFQLIPSICVQGRADGDHDGPAAFFSFGASGNVAEFKDKVVQHGQITTGEVSIASLVHAGRTKAVRAAKLIEGRLPESMSRRVRKVADTTGATHLLTGGADSIGGDPSNMSLPGSPHRKRIVEQMIMAAQRGDEETMNDAFVRLSSSGIPSKAEVLAQHTSKSFVHYASGATAERPLLPLAWWPRPFPGNFGDWLSPLVISEVSGHSVGYVSPTAKSSAPHLVSIGSIGRFVKPASIVVGTGVSSTDILLDKHASYVSVRGPITAELLSDSGGPKVESFGDPGILLSRLVPIERDVTNGRLALVRHHAHARVPITLPADIDELDVLLSHPDAIANFAHQLNEYDGVVTSAMHVMIACHSYGIPCSLVSFEGFESAVHGTGIKYRDYALGAGLDEVDEPHTIGIDLRQEDPRSRLTTTTITDEKLDEVEDAVRTAVAMYLHQHSEAPAER